MENKGRILEDIKGSMHLNSYEAKIYAALLSRGVASAGELAEISNVPRSRCYDVLEGLEKKGFVFPKIGKPIKYMAVAPEEAVSTIKKNIRKEENRMLQLYDEVKESEIFKELKGLYNSGINYINNDEISQSIIGKHNINLFMKDMLNRACKDINIVTSAEGAKRKAKILKKCTKKKCNTNINAPVRNLDVRNQAIKIKNRDMGMRLVNTDDEILIFTSDEEIHPDSESAVWLKSRFTVDAIKQFLE
jgi:sugar-specific transcriptional regulator TrmB